MTKQVMLPVLATSADMVGDAGGMQAYGTERPPIKLLQTAEHLPRAFKRRFPWFWTMLH